MTAVADPYAVEWPLRDEDGTTLAHLWNVGVGYERERRRVLAKVALAAHREDVAKERGWTYGLGVHRAVAAHREEREFYRRVPLTDQDRGLALYVFRAGPATYREFVRRLGGTLGRRQARRALRSLVSRGVVRSDVREIGRLAKPARFYMEVGLGREP